jgi:hypothetical protein
MEILTQFGIGMAIGIAVVVILSLIRGDYE